MKKRTKSNQKISLTRRWNELRQKEIKEGEQEREREAEKEKNKLRGKQEQFRVKDER